MGSLLEKNSESVRKRIEAHTFQDEEGDEYEGSKFGGFSDYFRRKKIKLQNLDAEVRSSSAGKPQIFRGIVAHVNGYTQPSLNDLHHLIVSHGGGFMQYLDGKTTVTHIIAANLTPKKAIEFKRYRMVKPAWIVDSVKAGKVLPWDAYRVIDEGSGQRLLGFDAGRMVNQVNTQEKGYRDQTSTSWYTSQVKTVADDIDNDEGAHFPSTQVVAFNGTGMYIDSPDQPKKSIETDTERQKVVSDDNPSSSAAFEVTSSLEDAFNDAAAGQYQAPKEVTAETESKPQPPEITTPFKPGGMENLSPQYTSSPTSGSHSNTRKGAHETETESPCKKAKVMTAEEHNAILLADPHIRKSSTANPEFIKQYYSESRLHHLSTWKADLKSRFQKMAAEKSASQRQPIKRKPGARRYIMHVDFDSFFCAVSLKNAPEYVDKPAVVAHGSGTGSEIASCNYPAREFGVKNGMWMKNALKLCPNIKVLPYDFPAYEEASQGFYEAILDVGGTVQSVSVDEALVDITSLCLPAGGTDGFGVHEGSIWREQEKADDIAQGLRTQIKEKTGCAVSIGIGGNILLAKVALRKAKPAGQHQIKPEDVLDFIGELTVQNLPGVAYSIGGKLEEIGAKFVKDVRQLNKDRLMTVLGPKTGEKIWDYSRGIDKTEVGEQVVRKSVSAEVNWGIRFISQPEAEEFVQNLCIELQRRLVDQRVKGRQLTMKIMKRAADAPLDPPKHLGHGKCDTYNKSIVLGVATNNAETIGREAVSILRSYGFSPGELRGLGVQMTKLDPVKFSGNAVVDGSQRRINFGTTAAPKLSKQITEDPIDDPTTPKKSKATPARYNEASITTPRDPIDDSAAHPKLKPRWLKGDDPIDDLESPQKGKYTPVHPAAAIVRANAADQSAKKLLNLTGTQFIIPSQIDPEVLAELPQDISSKLIAQHKSKPISREQSPALKPRSRSPSREASNPPLPSQLDPEVFDALPPDMKAEILATYTNTHTTTIAGPSRAQSLLPQSPRKPRPLPKVRTPTKPRRGRPRKFDAAAARRQEASSNFTQSNFVSNPTRDPQDQDSDSDTLDPDFLSALPDDMRLEIVEEQKRKRLAKKGGLGLMAPVVSKKRKPAAEPAMLGQRRIRLPPREVKPTFTTGELSTLPELRETLSAWHSEFAGEGPHEEDVSAMERYLRRVVLEERDLGKVVGVVRWIGWLVDESGDGSGKRAWSKALEGIKEKVQDAVRERGIGRLEL
jgi:DNA repair protein REV1